MTTDSDAARRQRKQQLIAEGAVHRASLALARRQLASGWQSRSPGRHAGLAGALAMQLLGSGAARAMLPLLLGGLAALARMPRLRRVARHASLAAAIAAAIGFLLRRKRP